MKGLSDILIRLSLTIVLSLLSASVVMAQKLKVESFVEKTTDLAAATNRRYDFNDTPCAIVKVRMAKNGAQFDGNIVGDVECNTSEYWVYMSAGSKRMRISVPSYLPLDVEFAEFDINKLESKTTYILVVVDPNDDGKAMRASLKKTSFYVQPEFAVGSMTTVGGGLGAYLSGFNLEFNVRYGLSQSEPIFWNTPKEQPYEYTYRPLAFDFRLGYGFIVANRIRFTPQLGAGLVLISGKGDHGKSSAYVMNAFAGCRAEFALLRNLSVYVTPGMNVAVSKGTNYKMLSDVSPTIKGWGNGFNLLLGLSVNI